jgi:hypothetical protein
MVTESGRHAHENGLDRLRAGQRLGTDLDPVIANRVRTQFLMGECELGAFAAMREVEIRVHSLGGFGDGQIGVPLMAAALARTPPGRTSKAGCRQGRHYATDAPLDRVAFVRSVTNNSPWRGPTAAPSRS